MIPDILAIAIDYFWTHCPDVRAEAMCDTQEEWEKMLEDYEAWMLEA